MPPSLADLWQTKTTQSSTLTGPWRGPDPSVVVRDALMGKPHTLAVDDPWSRERYPLIQFVKDAWHQIVFEPFIPGWHIESFCDHLTAIANRDITRLLVNIPMRSGKPIDAESMVLMHNGSRKRLCDIIPGDKVITHTGNVASVVAVHDQGMLDTVRISTGRQREVIAALDHPFLTPEGMVHAKDLHISQQLGIVARPRCIHEPCEMHKDEEFSLAGYFIGDGNVTRHKSSIAANITSCTPTYIDHIIACANVLGFKTRVNTTSKNVTYINLSKGVRPWLESIGLAGKNSYTKTIPAFIFEGNDDQVAQYLAAYFHCDGSISFQTKHKNSRLKRGVHIEFSSVSRELMTGTQHLLLRLGIDSALKTVTTKKDSKFCKAGYIYYRLLISMEDDVAKFYKNIPVLGYKKERFLEYFPLRQRFDEPIISDRIVSIEPSGMRHCMCLSLDKDYTFTANDIIVSNSVVQMVLFPAWVWITNPSEQFLCTSFNKELALNHAVIARRLMISSWYRERWGDRFRLHGDMNVKSRYENDKGGARVTVAVGGATGTGGSILLVDDLHSRDDDESPTHAEIHAAKGFFNGDFAGCLVNPQTSCIVVTGQRVSIDDISADILEKGGYCHLKIRQEYVAPPTGQPPPQTDIGWVDPRTTPGELMHEARWGPPQVAEAKRRGMRAYLAHHQQDPEGSGGNLFNDEWWQKFTQWPAWEWFRKIVLSWDMRFKDDKETGSFVVGQAWGLAPNGTNVFLLDEVRGRWDFNETKEAFVALSQKWPMARVKLLEDKANGPAIYAALRAKTYGITLVDPDGGKFARGEKHTETVKDGHVWLPADTLVPWITDWRNELRYYPNEPNDRGDAATQAWDHLLPRTFADDPRTEERERQRRRQQLVKRVYQQQKITASRTGA